MMRGWGVALLTALLGVAPAALLRPSEGFAAERPIGFAAAERCGVAAGGCGGLMEEPEPVAVIGRFGGASGRFGSPAAGVSVDRPSGSQAAVAAGTCPEADDASCAVPVAIPADGRTGGADGVPAVSGVVSPAASDAVQVGAADTAAYYPLLRGRRVAVLANHTSLVEGRHLVDRLHERGFALTAIFAPEHGFRGGADAGESVRDGVDAATGVPIRSLYDGRTNRPSDEAMRSFDVLLVDMQDVGLRFYTYYIAMLRMMEACAAFDRQVVVLDRPNPNGMYVDGPLLDMRYASGVGALPIPVVHGMTLGELARMAVGEGWCAPCDLRVVPCRGYTHRTRYVLPVAPSPNLPTQHAVYLYPSICPFEGTVVSLGRGTEYPFECYGHPDMKGRDFVFTPRPTPGAAHPPLEGRRCYGVDLRGVPDEEILAAGFDLTYVIDAYEALGLGEDFFTPMFEKLVGVDWVRRMIVEGRSAGEIRARWKPDLERFGRVREKYLIYD